MMFQISKTFLLSAWIILLLGKNPIPTKPRAYRLDVKLDRVILHTGKIMIAVYDNQHDFLIKPAIKRTVLLTNIKHTIVFTNLKGGEYAVTLFQDLDGDGKLNKVLSVPTEPYGLSNNPDNFPNWSETKFTINQNKLITIILKN